MVGGGGERRLRAGLGFSAFAGLAERVRVMVRLRLNWQGRGGGCWAAGVASWATSPLLMSEDFCWAKDDENNAVSQ